MRAARRAAVEAAAGARFWGLVLGTLGRQGNPRVLRHLQAALAKRGLEHVVVRSLGDPECGRVRVFGRGAPLCYGSGMQCRQAHPRMLRPPAGQGGAMPTKP